MLPLGRVPPGFLVGEGARDWAIRHGIHTVTSDKLVSEKAVKLYKVSYSILDQKIFNNGYYKDLHEKKFYNLKSQNF